MRKAVLCGVAVGILNFIYSTAIGLLMCKTGLYQPPANEWIIQELFPWFAFLAIVVMPITEEMIFRYAPIRITQKFTKNPKIIWSVIVGASILFGLAHGSWQHIFIQGAVGLSLSYVFLKHGLIASVTAHTILNIIATTLVFIGLYF